MALLIKKARNSLLKKWSMLLGCALGILGGTACQDQTANNDQGEAPMYGVPMNVYIIKGTVKSSDSNSIIPGIQITPDKLGNKALSINDGTFSVQLDQYAFDTKDQTVTLSIDDIDGTVNGSYLGKSVIIDIKATDYANGYFVKNIDIILDPVVK
jgi:putative lipoprotein (rSAM/lipoprotein system)